MAGDPLDMRSRRGEEFWKAVMVRVESGEAVKSVAASVGVLPQQVYWWRRRLAGTGCTERESRPGFFEVEFSGQPTVAARAMIDIVVGEVFVRVPMEASPSYVAALVRNLAGSC